MDNLQNLQVLFEQLSPTVFRLDITVPSERAVKILNDTYSELARHANISGFRPGKAPKNILNRHFGKDKIIKESSEGIVENTLWSVIRQKELTVVGRPRIDIDEWGGSEDFRYVATFEVIPQVPEIEYGDIQVKLPIRIIDDKLVDDHLHEIAVRFGSKTLITDRPARLGDIITIEFDGSVPDVMVETVEGEKAWHHFEESMKIELGSNKAIPGLEEALVGMELEEIREAEIKLPDDFADSRVRGKILKVKARLRAIVEVDPMELNDESIKERFKDLGIENLEQLKKVKKDELEAEYQRLDDLECRDQIKEYLSRRSDFPIPEGALRAEFYDLLDKVLTNLRGKGSDIEELLKPDNEEGLKLRKFSWLEAERRVRFNIHIMEIARREAIKVSEEEVANYIMYMGFRQGMKEKDLKSLLRDENFLASTHDEILKNKVLRFISSKVVPERLEINEFKKFAEEQREKSRNMDKEALASMEDPLVRIKREIIPVSTTTTEKSNQSPEQESFQVES